MGTIISILQLEKLRLRDTQLVDGMATLRATPRLAHRFGRHVLPLSSAYGNGDEGLREAPHPRLLVAPLGPPGFPRHTHRPFQECAHWAVVCFGVWHTRVCVFTHDPRVL